MGGAAGTSTSTRHASGSSANLNPAELQFIREAAQSGLAEVQMGQMALQKAQSEHSKSFGQMLVTDHQKANQELMAIASRKGVDIPTQLGASEQQIIQRLSSASGAEFDRLAAAENVKAHQKVIQQFQAAQNKVQDAELKAFIQKTLPVLQNHLKHAQQLQSEVSGGAQGGSEGADNAAHSSHSSSSSSQDSDKAVPAAGSPATDGDAADQQ